MARVPVATDDYSTDTLATDYENGPGAYADMAVSGGNILPSAANASCAAYRNDAVNDDQYSLITAAVQGDNDILGCIVRAQTGTGDGYEGVWRSNNDRWEIAVVDGGARTILAMQTVGYVDAAAGDQLRFEVEGQALRLYTIIDSVEVLQVETTDATHTGGLAGVAAAGVGAATDAQITALEIGNITADAAELSGSGTLNLAASGALTGSAGLSGSGELSLSGSGDLSGDAGLSGSGALGLSASGDLAGSASLSGSAGFTLDASGNLVIGNTADMSGAATLSLSASGNLAGDLALSGTAELILTASGDLLGGEPVGGHFWQPDTRKKRDDKKLRDRRDLRELIEKAAGLLETADEIAAPTIPDVDPVRVTPRPVFRSQVADLKAELGELKAQVGLLRPDVDDSIERIERIVAKASDDIVVRIAGVLTDIILELVEPSLQEIIDEELAA